MASTPPKRKASRASNRRRLLELLQHRPLPLRKLVKAIAANPSLVSLVMRAAASECSVPPPDIETAVVLLGTDGLRDALAKPLWRGSKAASKPHAGHLQALRRAITHNRYRIDPHAVAAAMLRELKRS